MAMKFLVKKHFGAKNEGGLHQKQEGGGPPFLHHCLVCYKHNPYTCSYCVVGWSRGGGICPPTPAPMVVTGLRYDPQNFRPLHAV